MGTGDGQPWLNCIKFESSIFSRLSLNLSHKIWIQPLKAVYVSFGDHPLLPFQTATNSDSWKFVNLSSRMFIRENKVIMQKTFLFIWLKIIKIASSPFNLFDPLKNWTHSKWLVSGGSKVPNLGDFFASHVHITFWIFFSSELFQSPR